MRRSLRINGGFIVINEDGIIIRRDFGQEPKVSDVVAAFTTPEVNTSFLLSSIIFASEHGVEALAAKLGLPVMVPTKESAALEKYAEGEADLCPFCKSADINGEGFEPVNGDYADQMVNCECCGSSWFDSYKRESAYHSHLSGVGAAALGVTL